MTPFRGFFSTFNICQLTLSVCLSVCLSKPPRMSPPACRNPADVAGRPAGQSPADVVAGPSDIIPADNVQGLS